MPDNSNTLCDIVVRHCATSLKDLCAAYLGRFEVYLIGKPVRMHRDNITGSESNLTGVLTDSVDSPITPVSGKQNYVVTHQLLLQSMISEFFVAHPLLIFV